MPKTFSFIVFLLFSHNIYAAHNGSYFHGSFGLGNQVNLYSSLEEKATKANSKKLNKIISDPATQKIFPPDFIKLINNRIEYLNQLSNSHSKQHTQSLAKLFNVGYGYQVSPNLAFEISYLTFQSGIVAYIPITEPYTFWKHNDSEVSYWDLFCNHSDAKLTWLHSITWIGKGILPMTWMTSKLSIYMQGGAGIFFGKTESVVNDEEKKENYISIAPTPSVVGGVGIQYQLSANTRFDASWLTIMKRENITPFNLFKVGVNYHI